MDLFRMHIYRFKFLLLIILQITKLAASDLIQMQPAVRFLDSNLPIVFIDTQDQTILDGQKINASMGVIDHGPGLYNFINDPPNNYDGIIGIEIRGSSSTTWPKKQYNVETRDSTGANRNVTLMGLPTENDWILNAPYIDRSFMRNTLIYQLSNEMGLYASRSRFCEVVLNGVYQGIYVLLEKIKRDRNRVNIEAMSETDNTGDAVTGGYIIKIDKPGNRGFYSSFPPAAGSRKRIAYQYHYPKDDVITSAQENYIQQFIYKFESMMASESYSDSVSGYSTYIDIDSFVDFFILSELSKNVDAYRLSTYLYKDRDSKDGKLHMGPIWDFNLAFGNANYYDGTDTDDWTLDELTTGAEIMSDQWVPPFWWQRLLADSAFVSRLQNRWNELRSTTLAKSHIFAIIDSTADLLEKAQDRNFDIWTPPGEYGGGFWPVPNVFYSFSTYQDEIDYLKNWIQDRFIWMDEAIQKLNKNNTVRIDAFSVVVTKHPFPNPFTEQTTWTYTLATNGHVRISLFDNQGRCVNTMVDTEQTAGEHFLYWDGTNAVGNQVATGVYFWHLEFPGESITRKIIFLR